MNACKNDMSIDDNLSCPIYSSNHLENLLTGETNHKHVAGEERLTLKICSRVSFATGVDPHLDGSLGAHNIEHQRQHQAPCPAATT